MQKGSEIKIRGFVKELTVLCYMSCAAGIYIGANIPAPV